MVCNGEPHLLTYLWPPVCVEPRLALANKPTEAVVLAEASLELYRHARAVQQTSDAQVGGWWAQLYISTIKHSIVYMALLCRLWHGPCSRPRTHRGMGGSSLMWRLQAGETERVLLVDSVHSWASMLVTVYIAWLWLWHGPCSRPWTHR